MCSPALKKSKAIERLEVFDKVSDGFELAEADLKLRGPGDFFGTKQHGLPPLRIANVIDDESILMETREIAAELIQRRSGVVGRVLESHAKDDFESLRSCLTIVRRWLSHSDCANQHSTNSHWLYVIQVGAVLIARQKKSIG